ncbi:MAG: PKD domain-containing protein [Planctomycetes bacterium]|nr:PKD domain-containing protein [Planctomycetota bacterium]
MRMSSRLSMLGALIALALPATVTAQSPLCSPTAPPWASNNGGTAGGVVFFDLNVAASVIISGFDCNLSTANASVTLEVYTTPNTYVGSTTTPANWTLVGSAGPVTSASAINLPTSFTLATPLTLTAGQYGIGFRVIGSGQRYTGTGTGAQVTTSTSELTLTSGAAISGLFTGSFFSFRNWNGCIHYTPAAGLFPSFTATPTSGATPLNVNFTDTTFTSDPNGVQTWAWDVDGDNIVDSNVQNPTVTYNTCGQYSVTLTVTDTLHPQASFTRTNYIDADPQFRVNANFIASPAAGVAPVTVNFTDTSTGSPTSWAWDLDGDTIVDSNAQNPSFTYSVGGQYTVTLTASNACYGDTETKVAFINVAGSGTNLPADKLAYQFNEVRGNTTANVATGGTFPARGTATNSTWQADPGLGRDRFDANETGFGSHRFGSATGFSTGSTMVHSGSLTVMWWLQRDPASTTTNPFGYAFSDVTFRSFIAGAAGTGITFRGSSLGNVDLTGNVIGNYNWQHVALVIDDAAGRWTWYWNGAPANTNTFTPNTFAYNGTQPFNVGMQGTGSFFSTHWAMDDFRMYNSALSFGDVLAAMGGETASNGAYDAGCAGPSGVPVLSASQRPVLPNPTYSLDLSNAEPGRPAALIIGTQTSLGGILPLDLSGLLGAGCALTVFPEIQFPLFTGAGAVNIPLPLPVDPSVNGGNGFHGYTQIIVLGTAGATTNSLDVNLQID